MQEFLLVKPLATCDIAASKCRDELDFFSMAAIESIEKKRSNSLRNGESNRLEPADRPAHDWYRFVLSYPPHLVRDYVVPQDGLTEADLETYRTMNSIS